MQILKHGLMAALLAFVVAACGSSEGITTTGTDDGVTLIGDGNDDGSVSFRPLNHTANIVGATFTTFRINPVPTGEQLSYDGSATNVVITLPAGTYNAWPITLTTLSGAQFALTAPTNFSVVAGQTFSIVLNLRQVFPDRDGDGVRDDVDGFPDDACSAMVLNDLCGGATDGTGGTDITTIVVDDDQDGYSTDNTLETDDQDPCIPDVNSPACNQGGGGGGGDIDEWSQASWWYDINGASSTINEVSDTEFGARSLQVNGPSTPTSWDNKYTYQLRGPATDVTIGQPLAFPDANTTATCQVRSSGGGTIYAEIARRNYPYSIVDGCYTVVELTAGTSAPLAISCTSDQNASDVEIRIQIGMAPGQFTFDDCPFSQ